MGLCKAGQTVLVFERRANEEGQERVRIDAGWVSVRSVKGLPFIEKIERGGDSGCV